MISYAQNGEDVVLRRVFGEQESGFYIDLGANDPVADSVTFHFSERGWRGINVEPAPGVFERLAARRPRDVNLNVGVSNRQSVLTFHDFPENQGLSTFSEPLAKMWHTRGYCFVERAVPVTTLAAICAAHCDRPIDFMKIDVEGHEREVIEGGDWNRWRPRVLIIEATWPKRWEHLVEAAGYHQALFDGVNRFYVRHEDRGWLPRLSTPPNIIDNYIFYVNYDMIESLRERLRSLEEQIAVLVQERRRREADWEQLGGPIAQGVARRLHRLSVRNPSLAAAVKRMVRIAR
jgi:FkbM family methyltransferase